MTSNRSRDDEIFPGIFYVGDADESEFTKEELDEAEKEMFGSMSLEAFIAGKAAEGTKPKPFATKAELDKAAIEMFAKPRLVPDWPFSDGYWSSDDKPVNEAKFIAYPMLRENETLLLAADAKSGKTLVSHTLGWHIAMGTDWGDIKISEARGVLYFALESRVAIRQRDEAYKRHMRDKGFEDSVPLFVSERSINLLKEDSRKQFALDVYNAAINFHLRFRSHLGLIVIDTVTKSMPGADQNAVADTSAAMEVINLIRSLGVKAAIILLHHLARAGNIRGSTVFEADPDTLTSLKKNNAGDEFTWIVDAARSVDEGTEFKFKKISYDLGVDTQGFPITAPVLIPLVGEVTKKAEQRHEQLKLDDNQLEVYNAFIAIAKAGDPITRDALIYQIFLLRAAEKQAVDPTYQPNFTLGYNRNPVKDVARQQVKRALEVLIAAHYVSFDDGTGRYRRKDFAGEL